MARKSRGDYVDSLYFHVIVQGYEKEWIFSKKEFINKYFNILIKEKENFDVQILAYCIMSNHAHLLIYCENVFEISKYMKKVNLKYAVYYNEVNKRVGYVFRDRFLSEPIKTEKYLYNCLAYIHMNPVAAGIVKYPEEYFYSSYNDFVNRTGIVNKQILELLFGSEFEFTKLFLFLHIGYSECMEYKTDYLKLNKEEIFESMESVLKEYSINKEELKDKRLLKFFAQKFNEKGISLRKIAEFFEVSNTKLKNIMCK